MSVLLTGATGFIGAQVLERLVARGEAVRVLVQPETLAQPQKVRHLKPRDNVEIIAGSLAEADVLAEAARGVTVVYHLAALLPGPGVHSEDLFYTNVQGTKNLLHASIKGGVHRFVFTSSAMVYDGSEHVQITEDSPLQPYGIYGQTKVDAEDLVRQYHRLHGLEYVILRPSPVYGPGAPYFEWLIRRILHHPMLTLSHGLRRVIHWIHVSDSADAVVLGGTQAQAAGNEFNIAGNEAVTYRELVAKVHTIAGRGPLRGHLRPLYRMQDCPLKYDIRKAGDLLGFIPKIGLQDGLAELITALDRRRMIPRKAGGVR